MNREQYDHARRVVASVIEKWDPYGLLELGAPADEFAPEVSMLVSRIPSIGSPEDAIDAVSVVFSEMFDPATFTHEQCRDAGVRLYRALHEGQLLRDMGR